MLRFLLRTTLLWLLILPSFRSTAQLYIDESAGSVQELVEMIFQGDSMLISNVTLLGSQESIAFFRKNNTNFPIDSGLVMITGDVTTVAEPNSQWSTSSTVNPLYSDDIYDNVTHEALLSIAESLGNNTPANATIVEFDFVPQQPFLTFRYSFASEEYNSWVCSSFNDLFALLISGPGISGPYLNGALNLATLPGSEYGVAVNTVHAYDGFNETGCFFYPDIQNYSEYFIDNEANSAPNSVSFNGYTTGLLAQQALIPGETYHLSLIICNMTDLAYQSGVFIEAKTAVEQCPWISANVGDPCSDGSTATYNDSITAWCTCEGNCAYPLTVNVWADLNGDGVQNNDEPPLQFFTLQNPDTGELLVTDETGEASLCMQSPSGTIEHTNLPTGYSQSACSYSFYTPGEAQEVELIITPSGQNTDAAVLLVGFESANPGFVVSGNLILRNLSTECLTNQEVTLQIPDNFLMQSVLPEFTPTANTFTTTVPTICPFSDISWPLLLSIDVSATAGEAYSLEASTTELINESDVSNNTASVTDTIVASFDPNDIQVNYPVISPQFVAAQDDWLTYTIRFQNTGTAPADFVIIEDDLPLGITPSTFEFLEASHGNLEISLPQNDMLRFHFSEIMLPDSSSDPEGSIGFVSFRIKPQPTLQLGDLIENQARIFFDYNAPIFTNFAETLVDESVSVGDLSRETLTTAPNPIRPGELMTLGAANLQGTAAIFDAAGKHCSNVAVRGGRIDAWPNLAPGMYQIQVSTPQGNRFRAKALSIR